MVRVDPVWWATISDLLVNLSAGWFGAIVVLPIVFPFHKKVNVSLLIFDAAVGIVSLLFAVQLRRAAGGI